jgi:hypothetical protein
MLPFKYKDAGQWLLYGLGGLFLIMLVGDLIAQDIFHKQNIDDLAEYTAQEL